MAKTCVFTGKKAVYGNRKNYRGKAKYLGGVGKKITRHQPAQVQAEPAEGALRR